MPYHVYIERAQDPSPGSLERAAQAIAARYGMPANGIVDRLAKGRFRVKANVDMRTAARFAADLERLGVVCTIVEEDSGAGKAPQAATAPRPPAIPAAPVRSRPPAQVKATLAGTGAAPKAGKSGSHAALAGAAGTPRPEPVAPATGQYQSGLAAAFGGEADSSPDSLGALADIDRNIESGMFRLAALDGSEDAAPTATASPAHATEPPAARAFAPPADDGDDFMLDTPAPTPVPAAAAVARPPAAPAAPVRVDDAFRPPELAQAMDLVLDTAPRPPAPRPAPRAITAEQPAVAAEPTRPTRALRPGVLVREYFLDSARVRFAIGVLLVVLVGFVPAQLYFGVKADAAQATVLEALQDDVELAKRDEEAWKEYDANAANEVRIRRDSLGRVRFGACLLWFAVSSGLGYIYFRKVPWERL
jgi:hypothetical protein